MIEIEEKKILEGCLGNFIFSLENSKLAVCLKERVSFVGAPEEKKMCGFYVQCGNVTYGVFNKKDLGKSFCSKMLVSVY